MTTTYPRLKAEATIKELLAYVSDLSTYEYWGNLCRAPDSISGPTLATARAIGSLRAECLDVYQCIWTKLEEQDAKEVLGASDAIRFRLLSLESLLSYYSLGYEKLPRRSIKLKSSKPANLKVPKQLLRQHLEQSMLTALNRQAARPQSLVSLHYCGDILHLHPTWLCLVLRRKQNRSPPGYGFLLPHPEHNHATPRYLHNHIPYLEQQKAIQEAMVLGTGIHSSWIYLLSWVVASLLLLTEVLEWFCFVCWKCSSDFYVGSAGAACYVAAGDGKAGLKWS